MSYWKQCLHAPLPQETFLDLFFHLTWSLEQATLPKRWEKFMLVVAVENFWDFHNFCWVGFGLGWCFKGVLNKVLYGEAPPEVQPLTLLYTFSTEEACFPFVYFLLTNGVPFMCVVPFNCSCKCTVFYIWINHKTRTSSWLFHSHKMHLLAFLDLFTDWNDIFPYPFIYLTSEIPSLSYTWSLKRLPLLGGAFP